VTVPSKAVKREKIETLDVGPMYQFVGDGTLDTNPPAEYGERRRRIQPARQGVRGRQEEVSMVRISAFYTTSEGKKFDPRRSWRSAHVNDTNIQPQIQISEIIG
jgi:hypothetical protein